MHAFIHSPFRSLRIMSIFLRKMENSVVSSIMATLEHVDASLSSPPDTHSVDVIEISRYAIGIIANVICCLLYTAPMLTFARVIRNKSTEDFSCFPYIMAFFNCVVYTWYGLPVISEGWKNLPLVTINGFGALVELTFILIYLWFAPPRGKKSVAMMMTPVIIFFIFMFTATLIMDDKALCKTLVGSLGFVASISMYGSPLVAVKQVIETKSVEFMPFFLSFFTFLTTTLWLIYGLLGYDVLLASPNFIGVPLGILQLVVYCIYKNKKPSKDLESGETPDLTSPLINGS